MDPPISVKTYRIYVYIRIQPCKDTKMTRFGQNKWTTVSIPTIYILKLRLVSN